MIVCNTILKTFDATHCKESHLIKTNNNEIMISTNVCATVTLTTKNTTIMLLLFTTVLRKQRQRVQRSDNECNEESIIILTYIFRGLIVKICFDCTFHNSHNNESNELNKVPIQSILQINFNSFVLFCRELLGVAPSICAIFLFYLFFSIYFFNY